MKRIYLVSIILLLVAASSAVAQDVRYNFDNTANFAGFKTYKWVPIKDAVKLPELVDRQVRAAFEAEFAKKGLRVMQRISISDTRPQ
jgi:hypothetical protein